MKAALQSRNGSSPRIPQAQDLNTIPDPRAPSPATPGKRSPSSGPQHPDMSNEVATLSAKLINAINNQTTLDDALQETRHELEEARSYIAHLERESRAYKEAIASGALVTRADFERKEESLEKQMAEEQKKRNSAERQRKGMESELETLTGQLFEEANAMVAAARHEKQEADRKADMFKTKLEDTEVLLSSQQDQLTQLKEVLQAQRDRPRDITHSSNTAPTTPVVNNSTEKLQSGTFHAPTHTRNALSTQSLPPPESPLHFDHLIHPVVRTDVQSYEDFVGLLRTNKGSTPPSRSASGSYATGLNVLGLGSKEFGSQSTVIPSIRSAITPSSRSTSAQTTPTPGGNNSPRPDDTEGPSVALKDTKYFKRALAEDIEPTLRLDTAPGLSWLARRGVLTSITTGRLIVEPFPRRHAYHSPAYACAMCGESRTNEEHIRRYRFRASDSDEAQRYPTCDYCLARLRSTCDFTSFLRMAKKGAMKNETIDECRAAWEECIKLREKMFWSRVGGGVIPTPGSNPVSPINGAYLETDKESGTDSRSDSDLASISRADSQHTTSSEQPELSPLSRADTLDAAAAKETLPLSSATATPTADDTRVRPTDTSLLKQSFAGARDERPSIGTITPPPSAPEPRPTQPGSRDAVPAKHEAAPSARPPSSAASGKAFFEAKTTQAHGEPTAASPSEPVYANPFKRPSAPASASRPPSSRDTDPPSPFDSSIPTVPDALEAHTLRRGSNTMPWPSSSKSTKAFSFGPRDGGLPSAATGDSTTDDADGAATLDRLTTRTTAGTTAHASSPASSAPNMSAVSYLGALFTPKTSRSPSRQPPATEARTEQASDIKTANHDVAASKAATGIELAGSGLPTSSSAPAPTNSPSPRGRPVSAVTGLAATPLALSPSPRRPVSALPSSTPISSPSIPTQTSTQFSQSPRLTPKDSNSLFSTPRMSFSETAPQLTPSAPGTPSQQPAKRAGNSKVAALASRFGGEEPASPVMTPPPLRPATRSADVSRPGSSGSGLRSGPGSPERKTFDNSVSGPERKPFSHTARSRRQSTIDHNHASVESNSAIDDALAALGSPERKSFSTTRSRRQSTVDSPRPSTASGARGSVESKGSAIEEAMASLGSSERFGRVRADSQVSIGSGSRGQGVVASRSVSPVKRVREGSDLSRSRSPVKIPGAFA